MKNSRFLCLLLLCLVGLCRNSKESAIITVDVHSAHGLLGAGHLYLDVRTEEEFKKGHLDNALNIPFIFFTPEGKARNPAFVEQVSSVCNKKDFILVGCQSGVRSLLAAADLVNAGFENVKNMGGGFAAWVENGFVVKKPEEDSKRPCLATKAANVDVHAAKCLVASGHRYLDVRTEEEFEKGHLQNSLNIPYIFFTPQGMVKNKEFLEQVSLTCNKEDQIVVGCQSGVRSLQAATDLLKAGFKNVKNMEGGYAAWVENGFDVKNVKEDL